MKSFHTLLFTLLSFASLSQITITSQDLPAVNDTFSMHVLTSLQGYNPDITGAGHTWNFSQLNATGSETDEYKSVSATPFAYQLYFNNGFQYPEHKATYGITGEDLDVGGMVTIKDVYDYFINDNDSYRQVGFGANINNIPMPVRYDSIDIIYQFPLNYGDKDTSYAEFDISVPNFGHYGQRKWRYTKVDGHGTLITPEGTYQTLRVKTELVIKDTFFMSSIGFGTTIPRNITEYKWLAKNTGQPVMEVMANNGIVTNVRYQDSAKTVQGIAEGGQRERFALYPNPAVSNVYLKHSAMDVSEVQVYDHTGRETAAVGHSISPGLMGLNISQLTGGVYFVELITHSGEHYLEKLIVTK